MFVWGKREFPEKLRYLILLKTQLNHMMKVDIL